MALNIIQLVLSRKQWGFIPVSNTINFPIVFNTACFYLKTSISNPAQSPDADYDFQIISLLKNKANLVFQGYNNTNTDYRHGVYYLALGY